MEPKKVTGIFIFILIVLIAIYDVWAISSSGTEASISHLMIEWSYQYPVFTFMMGFVMGHLFWRVRQTKAFNDLNLKVESKVEHSEKTK